MLMKGCLNRCDGCLRRPVAVGYCPTSHSALSMRAHNMVLYHSTIRSEVFGISTTTRVQVRCTPSTGVYSIDTVDRG